MPPLAVLYPVVRGGNTVVNTMRAMGYRYIHFQNGYDNLTQCPVDGAICIKGNVGSGSEKLRLDEFDIAILSRTPLIEAMAAFTDVESVGRRIAVCAGRGTRSDRQALDGAGIRQAVFPVRPHSGAASADPVQA